MKFFFVSLVIFISVQAQDLESCTNLSHIYKLGAGDVHFKFLSCDLVERETYLNGQAMGDKNYLKIQNDWIVTNIDDDYEVANNHQRWMWSKDRTKLIHEYVVDSFSKTDSSFDFMSGSDVFSLVETGVQKAALMIRRNESATGEIKQQALETTIILKKIE